MDRSAGRRAGFRRGLFREPALLHLREIELVYGRWFWYFKNNLIVAETLVAALLTILLMLALSTAKTYRAVIRSRLIAGLATLGWTFEPKPERVPGD